MPKPVNPSELQNTMNVSQTTLHFAASIWLVALYNTTFFQHVMTVYPLSMENAAFLASLVIGLTAILLLLLTVIGWRSTTKPVLTVLLLLAAITAYFANNYNVVIDHTMIRNIVQTNLNEVWDLIGVKLVGYVLFLGILPSGFVWWLRLKPVSWKKEIVTKVKVASLCVAIVSGLLFFSSTFFFSFFKSFPADNLRFFPGRVQQIFGLLDLKLIFHVKQGSPAFRFILLFLPALRRLLKLRNRIRGEKILIGIKKPDIRFFFFRIDTVKQRYHPYHPYL